jgi:hypothetical protein
VAHILDIEGDFIQRRRHFKKRRAFHFKQSRGGSISSEAEASQKRYRKIKFIIKSRTHHFWDLPL